MKDEWQPTFACANAVRHHCRSITPLTHPSAFRPHPSAFCFAANSNLILSSAPRPTPAAVPTLPVPPAVFSAPPYPSAGRKDGRRCRRGGGARIASGAASLVLDRWPRASAASPAADPALSAPGPGRPHRLASLFQRATLAHLARPLRNRVSVLSENVRLTAQ